MYRWTNRHLDSPEVSNPLLNDIPISLHTIHTPCSVAAPAQLNHLPILLSRPPNIFTQSRRNRERGIGHTYQTVVSSQLHLPTFCAFVTLPCTLGWASICCLTTSTSEWMDSSILLGLLHTAQTNIKGLADVPAVGGGSSSTSRYTRLFSSLHW